MIGKPMHTDFTVVAWQHDQLGPLVDIVERQVALRFERVQNSRDFVVRDTVRTEHVHPIPNHCTCWSDDLPHV